MRFYWIENRRTKAKHLPTARLADNYKEMSRWGKSIADETFVRMELWYPTLDVVVLLKQKKKVFFFKKKFHITKCLIWKSGKN